MAGKIVVQAGEKYGRLAIKREIEKKILPSGQSRRRVLCTCECGSEKVAFLDNIRRGLTTSCGCFHSERASECARTHGQSGKQPSSRQERSPASREYNTWVQMHVRTSNPNSPAFPGYGARGIQVCDRWSGEDGFENFLMDMGPRPEGHSLDRTDNSLLGKGAYSPENCRWVTQSQQAINTRSSRFWIVNGTKYESAKDARVSVGVSQSTLERRCRSELPEWSGWTKEYKYPRE